MKARWQILLAVAIMLTGTVGLITYDYYIRPFVLAKSVVVAKQEIPENQTITPEMLAMVRVPNDLVPTGAVFGMEDVLGKSALVTLGTGTMLTKTMVDMQDLYPKKGEVIFPIPKEAIYAVNGSLRKQDTVDISLIKQEQAKQDGEDELIQPIIEKARVVYVRTEDNQTVKDTEKGDINQRETATGRVAAVEIAITKEDRDMLIKEIGKGNRLWIARVGQ